MVSFRSSCLLAIICLGFGVSDANASLLFRAGFSGTYGYEGSNSSRFTSYVNQVTGGDVMKVADFSDSGLVSSACALFIEAGDRSETLSQAEQANILNFITSGKKVVMIGENALWSVWNNSILDLVGGSYSGGQFDGSMNTLINNDLTAGVSAISVPTSGTEDGLGGGVQLFDQNTVTLWGANALSILDVNVFTDSYLPFEDNEQFMENVIDWAAADCNSNAVPEPGALAIWAVVGLAAAVGYRSRRKRR